MKLSTNGESCEKSILRDVRGYNSCVLRRLAESFWGSETMASSQPKHPRKVTRAELQEVGDGVRILDERTVRLKCESCGQVWSPNLRSGGRLPRALVALSERVQQRIRPEARR